MNRKTAFPRWRLRTVVRCVALVALAVALLAPLPWRVAPQVATGASPFVGIAATLATRSLEGASFAWIVVLVVAMVRRRWFCRWACPVGLMTECAGRISPISPSRSKPVPRLGIWLVLLSLSAAAVGYPLFLWLDPLAMFGGTLGLAVDPAAVAARAAGSLLVAVVLLSYILPGTWCLKLCPLGATQELAASPRIAIQRRLAAAGATLEASPANDELIAEPLNRRSLLTTGLGAVCAVAGVPLGLAMREKTQAGQRKTLRPPGAALEWQFGQLCLRRKLRSRLPGRDYHHPLAQRRMVDLADSRNCLRWRLLPQGLHRLHRCLSVRGAQAERLEACHWPGPPEHGPVPSCPGQRMPNDVPGGLFLRSDHAPRMDVGRRSPLSDRGPGQVRRLRRLPSRLHADARAGGASFGNPVGSGRRTEL